MLRALEPADQPPPLAYRVPWSARRDDPLHPVVVNSGPDAVDFVRVFWEGAGGDERVQLWGQVRAGEHLELCLCAADVDEVVVTLAWFRLADGLEYLWRFVT